MTWLNVLLALHLLGAVLWVGGMGFALIVLRPSLGALEPSQRMTLHMQVFRRFFRLVWHTMPLMLVTGYAMVFGVFGGFGGVNWAVHVMHLTGLIMAALFLVVVFGPWRTLRAGGGQAEVDRIRRLVTVNLAIGLLTVIVAAFAV
jgi:uncharacterized membrane protein